MIEMAASRSLLRALPDGARSTGGGFIPGEYQPVGMWSRRTDHPPAHGRSTIRMNDPHPVGMASRHRSLGGEAQFCQIPVAADDIGPIGRDTHVAQGLERTQQ